MKRVLVSLVLLGGGAAGALQIEGTFAGFQDAGSGTGHFEAEVVENSTHDPWHAYEDVNRDDLFTEGVDVKIDDREILDGTYTVQRARHGLVIPKSVGPVETDGPIRFEAGNKGPLTVEVRLASATGVTLTAGTDARLDEIVAETTGDLSIEARGTLSVPGAYLRTDVGELTLTGKEGVDALGLRAETGGDVSIASKKGTIGLVDAAVHAGGHLSTSAKKRVVNADGSSLAADGTLHLASGGDVRVKRATLETPDDVVLTAGTHKDTIYVQDARFRDANDVAQAAPDGVEIVGEPAEGSIDHDG